MVVCVCNAIRESQVREAARNGSTTAARRIARSAASRNAASASRSREPLSIRNARLRSVRRRRKPQISATFSLATSACVAANSGASYRKVTTMKGDARVIEYLNEALKNELTAVNQYWLHYRLLDHWGVKKLAQFERHESIDEMKHADWLAERILFLDGLPNFQLLGRLRIGETVEEILKADLALEIEAVGAAQGAVAHCEEVKDFVSRDLFARILASEEEHVDTLETPVRDDRADGHPQLRPAQFEGRKSPRLSGTGVSDAPRGAGGR